MKTSFNYSIRQVKKILAATTIILSGLFASCEPEAVDMQSSEDFSNLEMYAPTSQSENAELNKQIAALRAYVAPYHNIEKAMEDGYVIDITGYMSQMGHHFLKAEYLDNNFDLLRPELLIYAPGPNNKWRLVGVEYATLIEDISNPPPAPEGFIGNEDQWSINTTFEVWTLHVWVGLNNPNGIFAMHNPRLP